MSTTCCPDDPIIPIAELDFLLPIGADYPIPLRFGPLEDPIVEENLTDFTGYSSELEVRDTNELGKVLLRLTTDNGGITIATVVATANFTAENTAPLPFRPMVYFWRFTSPAPSSVQRTLLKGKITPDRA